MDVDWLVAFVNEYATRTRITAGEQDQAYPPLTELGEPPSPADADLGVGDLIEVADRLFEVFAAAPDVETMAAAVERILDPARVRLHASVSDGQLRRSHVPEGDGPALAPATAMALLQFVEANGPDSLGCCVARRCTDVFVDRSPQQTRRHCSTTCHNRERVARHRARKAAATAS